VIRHALFCLPAKMRYNALPRVIFTDPELAHVGLTDVEAGERGYTSRVLRWPLRENDRAQTEGTTTGHVKVIAGRRGRILGGTVAGRGAAGLIAPWTLAIDRGLPLRALAQVVAPYPTLGEASKRAAMSAFSSLAADTRLRRIIGWFRRMG
jgi:pyruvate/2-oxoglutarate dehydrogenase complex dihydrolipoamide dehydrogenase (E3) component